MRDRHHVRGSSRDARHFGAPRARTSRRTPGRRASPTTPRDRSSPSRRWPVRAWTAPAEEAKEPRLDFFALRPPMKASARVPVLAFAAAFLVSFNVFATITTVSAARASRGPSPPPPALSILDADAGAERAIDKATASHRCRVPRPPHQEAPPRDDPSGWTTSIAPPTEPRPRQHPRRRRRRRLR